MLHTAARLEINKNNKLRVFAVYDVSTVDLHWIGATSYAYTHLNMNTKTKRITLQGSREFKAVLAKESRKEGLSVSEWVRRRCERAPTEDERVLLALAEELSKSTADARQALEEGLAAAHVVRQMRKAEK